MTAQADKIWSEAELRDPQTPALARLQALMARLRHPEQGCAWDLAQDFASIAPHTLEEAYEVVDAIQAKDMQNLRDELGDLLLQVIFLAQLAEEEALFDLNQVIEALIDKLIRRHPHLFGQAAARDAAAQHKAWEAQKADERAEQADPSAMASIARALPALTRAEKLQKRAARVGFDWPDTRGVLAKLHEEAEELTAAHNQDSTAAKAEEYGDLLFTLVNLGRHLKLDPEGALRATNDKFERRFRAIEQALGDLSSADALAMNQAWDQVKAKEQ